MQTSLDPVHTRTPQLPIKLPKLRNSAAPEMLDTVMVAGPWPMRGTLLPGRTMSVPGRNAAGLRIRTDFCGRIMWAEGSLPKLLFGHNGRVLEGQAQIDAAMTKLHTSLSEVAHVADAQSWTARRVDMAWNFDLEARQYILAHSALWLRGIHGAATLFKGGEGVAWQAAKSRFGVRLYDKSRQTRGAGSVLRAEVSLRGPKVRLHFKGNDWRNFDRLYTVYRNIMATIPPIPKVERAENWKQALACFPPEIRTQYLALLAHKSPRTLRSWRREVEGAAARLPAPFSWAETLPLDHPPAPIEVLPRTTSCRRARDATERV